MISSGVLGCISVAGSSPLLAGTRLTAHLEEFFIGRLKIEEQGRAAKAQYCEAGMELEEFRPQDSRLVDSRSGHFDVHPSFRHNNRKLSVQN